MTRYYVRLDNGIEVHLLEYPDRAAAAEVAGMCRIAAPTLDIRLVCIPENDAAAPVTGRAFFDAFRAGSDDAVPS